MPRHAQRMQTILVTLLSLCLSLSRVANRFGLRFGFGRDVLWCSIGEQTSKSQFVSTPAQWLSSGTHIQ